MIIEKQNRKKLAEGRNFGMGFAILDKLDNGNYNTLNAFTACKDFLNNLVFIENTGMHINKIYGFQHKQTNIFKNKDYFYLGVKILDYNIGGHWDQLNNMKSSLKTNKLRLLKNINHLEKKFEIKSFTIFEELVDDVFIYKLPIYWVQNPYFISFITMFMRLFFNCTAIKGINYNHKPFIKDDSYYVIDIIEAIKKFQLLKNYPIYEIIPKSNDIHNNGFMYAMQNVK